MKNVAIIGSAELAKQIAFWLASDNKYKCVGFFDNEHSGTIVTGPILGTDDDVVNLYKKRVFDELIIGIGYIHFHLRELLFDTFTKEGISFSTFIHKSAFVADSANIYEGTVIYPRAVLDKDVIIEKDCIININTTVSHNSTIKGHSFLSPSCVICGRVSIGKRCFIGANSTILPEITITDDVTIGAGAVVTKSITEPGTYVGIPARRIK